jgi:hypothetical protein
MRFILVGLLVSTAAACGSDPSPSAACNQIVVATCAKFYECLTAAELASIGYPASEAACVTQQEQMAGCANQTAANACTGNETYHGDQVDPCDSQIKGLECSQIRDPAFNIDNAAPACNKVCSI